MSMYRITYSFNTKEEAETKEQAIEQANEYFFYPENSVDIQKRAEHFTIKVELFDSKGYVIETSLEKK
jgi:hypothetical protein